jgi:hypothetical protein
MSDSERLSEADEYEFRKIRMSREIVDQVTKELKYKFWIVVVIALVAAYFGISKYLDEAVKNPIDDLKTKTIVASLAHNSEFQALVATQTLANATFLQDGNEVDCTQTWDMPQSISYAKCPPNSMLLSGGCSMKCLSMRHLVSIPVAIDGSTTLNAWQCRHAPQSSDQSFKADKDEKRTFHAAAICLTVKAR